MISHIVIIFILQYYACIYETASQSADGTIAITTEDPLKEFFPSPRCKGYTRGYVDNFNFSITAEQIVIHRTFGDNTSIGISWTPVNDTELCGYAIYYYRTKYFNRNDRHLHELIEKEPGATDHTITGLEPGTQYEIYIVTFFSNSKPVPRSWHLSTPTDGYGPDNGCFCSVSGSLEVLEKRSESNCDQKTGQCQCKNEQTTGRQCDSCKSEDFYMSDRDGCVKCDGCDLVRSNGSCYADGGSYGCYCKPGYSGRLCDQVYSSTAVAGIAIAAIVLTIAAVLAGIFLYCRCCRSSRPQGFWTVQLKDDRDNVNFSTLMEEPDVDNFNFGKKKKVPTATLR